MAHLLNLKADNMAQIASLQDTHLQNIETDTEIIVMGESHLFSAAVASAVRKKFKDAGLQVIELVSNRITEIRGVHPNLTQSSFTEFDPKAFEHSK